MGVEEMGGRVRLKIAESRVRMAEPLEELKALNQENQRLDIKIESRKEILRKFEMCESLVQNIQEFERDASSSKRLKGSSVRLLQEEQQRLKFRKKKERLVEDLLAKIALWESAAGESFLHKGVPI